MADHDLLAGEFKIKPPVLGNPALGDLAAAGVKNKLLFRDDGGGHLLIFSGTPADDLTFVDVPDDCACCAVSSCSVLQANTRPTSIIINVDGAYLGLWSPFGVDPHNHIGLLDAGVECFRVGPCTWRRDLPKDPEDLHSYLEVRAQPNAGPTLNWGWEIEYSSTVQYPGPPFFTNVNSILYWDSGGTVALDGSLTRDIELEASTTSSGSGIAEGAQVLENPGGTEAVLTPVAPLD